MGMLLEDVAMRANRRHMVWKDSSQRKGVSGCRLRRHEVTIRATRFLKCTVGELDRRAAWERGTTLLSPNYSAVSRRNAPAAIDSITRSRRSIE
jgi:hypothetical protein